MLNGTTGAAAVCCAMPEAKKNGSGIGVGLPGGSVNIGPVQVPRTARGLLETIGAAIDRAVHGGDGVAGRPALRANGYRAGGLNPVPFPMVNPFKPVVRTRLPVTALTAWPDRFTYTVPAQVGNQEPDDEQSSLSGLGYSWGDFGSALPQPTQTFTEYASVGPTKLQTVLGTIQATLPATIQALRAQPSNIYPGSSVNPYGPYASNAGGYYPGSQQPGADIGASAGAAVGNVGDTIGGIVQRHPYLVLAGVAGAVLLFMNPPRRR